MQNRPHSISVDELCSIMGCSQEFLEYQEVPSDKFTIMQNIYQSVSATSNTDPNQVKDILTLAGCDDSIIQGVIGYMNKDVVTRDHSKSISESQNDIIEEISKVLSQITSNDIQIDNGVSIIKELTNLSLSQTQEKKKESRWHICCFKMPRC